MKIKIMTKKSMIICGTVLGVGAVSAAIAVPLVLLTQRKMGIVKYDYRSPEVKNGRLFSNLEKNTKDFITDPNANKDAINALNGKFANLSVSQLQKDFNNVLTNFFDCFEIDNNNLEAEIEKVSVISINKNESTNTRTAQLEVTYDVEKNDDKEKLETQTKTFEIKPAYITYSDIRLLSNMLNDSKYNNNNNIDLEDLKELFFGEKWEKDADILDDDYDVDDKGIFHILADLNKEYNGISNVFQGGMMGYEVRLGDLAYESKKRTFKNTIDETTTFKVPSLEIFTYAIPHDPISFGLNLKKIGLKTKAEFLEEIKKTSQQKPTLSDKLPKTLSTPTDVSIVKLNNYFTNLKLEETDATATYIDDASKKTVTVEINITNKKGNIDKGSYKFNIHYSSFSNKSVEQNPKP